MGTQVEPGTPIPPARPSDAVTFVFTDIEGSTERWNRNYAAMRDAVRRHDGHMHSAIAQRDGYVFKTIGDAFCAVFDRPHDAIEAILNAHRALAAEDFSGIDGLRVRAALHTGTADERDGDYFGPAVNKVARLLAIGHGGQILVTGETAALIHGSLPANVSLRDLGHYHLKDFTEPQRVHQVLAPELQAEFPPLRSLGTLPSDLAILDASQFHPVTSFSGRHAEIFAVRAALQREGAIAVIHGLGGVGKSSIAREYGWRHRDEFSVVWWLSAQSEDGIIDGLLRLGAMFVQGLDQLADRRAAAQRVINSLLGGFDKPVLLIFDNLEDEALMRAWLPRTARALATSRGTSWGSDIRTVGLQTWTLETAVEYLKHASGRADLSEADARTIAQSLGALPLALAHAAAALRNLRMVTPQRYIVRLFDHLKKAPHGAEYPLSVFATFNTAIAQAEQQAPGAAAILCFAAFFAPDAIPDELLRQANGLCPDGLQPLVEGSDALDLRSAVASELQLDEALGALDRLSLLTFAQSTGTYGIHRLVRLAARDLVNDAGAWAAVAVTAAKAIFPRADFSNWAQCERVLPHARRALNALSPEVEPASASELARRCAIYLWARGEYGESERLCTRALSIVQNALGPDHPDVSRALNNLAVLYIEFGRFREAEPLLLRASALRQKEDGPNSPSVAFALCNLGIVYMEPGRFEEAEAVQERALAIRERSLPHDHHETLANITALGVLRQKQERHAEAETLLSRVLAIEEQNLGPAHPDVALTLLHLADAYAASGRNEEAQARYQRALAIWDQAHELFGPSHPDVAECLYGLSVVYRNQGRSSEANAALKKSLAIREQMLGPEHPLTKMTRSSLEALQSEPTGPPP